MHKVICFPGVHCEDCSTKDCYTKYQRQMLNCWATLASWGVRILSRFYTEYGAQLGTRSYDPWDHDLTQIQESDAQLTEPSKHPASELLTDFGFLPKFMVSEFTILQAILSITYEVPNSYFEITILFWDIFDILRHSALLQKVHQLLLHIYICNVSF